MAWTIAILEDPNNDFTLLEFLNYDYEIKKRIPMNYGIGVVYTVDGKGKYKTVEDSQDRVVCFKISTWIGMGDYNAKHFYGRFIVNTPSVEVLSPADQYEKVGERFCTNVMPKKYASSIEFDITRVAKKAEMGFNPISGERRVETQKGQHTHGFNDLETLRAKMNEEFERIFGNGWILRDSTGQHDVDKEFEGFKDHMPIGESDGL
jgi:hypothetical protein